MNECRDKRKEEYQNEGSKKIRQLKEQENQTANLAKERDSDSTRSSTTKTSSITLSSW